MLVFWAPGVCQLLSNLGDILFLLLKKRMSCSGKIQNKDMHAHTHLSLSLCDPVDYIQPARGSSVPGISQVRILDWVAISSSRESSRHRD